MYALYFLLKKLPDCQLGCTDVNFNFCYGCSYFVLGHVGPPMPCNKIKLVDVPDMDYYAKDGKGEVRKERNFI